MSSLILPNKWTSQPQVPVGIDWGNPLVQALGLVDVWIPVNGLFTPTLIRKFTPIASVGNFKSSVNSSGRSLEYTAVTANNGLILANDADELFPVANTASIFVIRQSLDTTARTSTLFGYHVGIAGPDRTLAHCPYSDGNIYWDLGDATTTTRISVASGGKTRNKEAYAFIGGPTKGREIWRNGIKLAGDATKTGARAATTGSFRIGSSSSATTETNDLEGVNLFIIGSKEWPDLAIKALSDNPWQIFKAPARRLWVAGAGGLTLSPSLYTDPDTFYSPTVSPGAVTLSPSLFTESDTFYAATVTPGAITLSPALVVDADTFYAATVTGSVNLTPSLLSNSNTFYSPTVSTGSVNISPALFNDADTFYSPTVSLDGSPQTLTPSLFSDADTFHPATVTAGGVTLNPSLFADADTFYIPTVSLDGAPQNLTPSLYVDSDTFYSPVVSSSGSQNLSPSLFVDADIFYPFSMVNGGFAKRGEYENDQSARRMHIQESTRSNIQTSRRR